MKGIIFNLLENVVTQHHGADFWDALLDASGVPGSFTSLGNYDDEYLTRLVAAASEALKIPPDAVIRWFGIEAMPILAGKYSAFFEKHRNTRSFLLTLNAIIHPEVKKLYHGADTPDFDIDASAPDVLVMGYHSKRRLCALAEGFVTGASAHFGEKASIQHPLCMHRGDASCRLEISFANAHG